MATSGAAGKGAAATGDFAASQAAGPEAAAHSAAAAAAGDVGGQGAAASAADAAMAAAEAADTVRFGCGPQASCFSTCLLSCVHIGCGSCWCSHGGVGVDAVGGLALCLYSYW